MTEHQTQSAIIDLIRLRGGVATRVNSGSAVFKRDGKTQVIRGADKGTADILACYKWRYLAIEVKHGRGKVSIEQLVFLESVRSAGGSTRVAYSVDDVTELLDMLDGLGEPGVMVDIEQMEEK